MRSIFSVSLLGFAVVILFGCGIAQASVVITPLSGNPPLDYFYSGGSGFLGEPEPYIGDAEIDESINTPNMSVWMEISGHLQGGMGSNTFIKRVYNNTEVPWDTFLFEIWVDTNHDGIWEHSTEYDGISFNQPLYPPPPRLASDKYSSVYIDELSYRDFVRFEGGVVNPGESVLFRFQISDNDSNNPFRLEQMPNGIPEPATLSLVALGGLAALWRKRR